MNVDAAVAAIESELRAGATAERATREQRYLKSDLAFIGATVPTVAGTVKQLRRANPELSRDDLLLLTTRLWHRGVFELRMAAVDLLELYLADLQPADLDLIESMLREAGTWALVDNLAASIAGPLVERHPELASTLDRWASDDDFWIRRSALLALLKPLRAGGGDFDRFGRYADQMLEEREFFIRKAIGWVLRDTSRRRPELVAAWVAPRTHRMSGVTIREAVKKLPPHQADELMDAYRAGRPAVTP
jgi:3-methyladenine DNA glycosylase AlkD